MPGSGGFSRMRRGNFEDWPSVECGLNVVGHSLRCAGGWQRIKQLFLPLELSEFISDVFVVVKQPFNLSVSAK